MRIISRLDVKENFLIKGIQLEGWRKYGDPVDLVGFHGQTIFHNPKERITYQIGDGKLLSQIIKKEVIYNF